MDLTLKHFIDTALQDGMDWGISKGGVCTNTQESAFKKKWMEKNKESIIMLDEMIAAIEYYEKGVDRFFEKINWGKSFLDAESIQFMNEHGIKFKSVLAKLNRFKEKIQPNNNE